MDLERWRQSGWALALVVAAALGCGDSDGSTTTGGTETSTTDGTATTTTTMTTGGTEATTGGTETSMTGGSETGSSSSGTETDGGEFNDALFMDHDAYLLTPYADESPLGSGEADTEAVPLDPAMLHLFLGDAALTCEEPEPLWGCGEPLGRWHIALPLELQDVGVYDLTTQGYTRHFFVCAGDDCPCTQVDWWEGNGVTLEITAIDDASIVGAMCQKNGCKTFTAPRC